MIDDTQDLRRRGKTDDPEALEERTRYYGRVSLTAGITLLIITPMISLGAAAASENDLFTGVAAQQFAMLTFIACMIAGLGLLIIGSFEFVHRPVRERQRLQALQATRKAIDDRERYDNIAGLVAPIAGRLVLIEERLTAVEQAVQEVPDYGKGVIDGVQMRQEVLGDLGGN